VQGTSSIDRPAVSGLGVWSGGFDLDSDVPLLLLSLARNEKAFQMAMMAKMVNRILLITTGPSARA
jgi:hypothetical protein